MNAIIVVGQVASPPQRKPSATSGNEKIEFYLAVPEKAKTLRFFMFGFNTVAAEAVAEGDWVLVNGKFAADCAPGGSVRGLSVLMHAIQKL